MEYIDIFEEIVSVLRTDYAGCRDYEGKIDFAKYRDMVVAATKNATITDYIKILSF